MTFRLSQYSAAFFALAMTLSAGVAGAQKLRVPQQGAPAAAQSNAAPQSPDSAARPDATATAAGDAQSPAYPVAEILVRINGQIISKQDLERADQQMNEQAKEESWSAEEMEKRKKALLSDLIDQQLLLSRGKELNIKADDELIRRLDEIRKQNHLDSMEDLEKAARSQGVSFEDFKANIRNNIVTQQVIRDEVGRSIHLTSTDAQAYYQAHKDQFTKPESVHLSEILIPAGTTDGELASAQARADKVYSELQKGSSFAEMAKSISTGPTAAQGGDLGVFKRGQLAKELEDKTFVLQKDQLTEPIRTRQGFVILKMLEHTPEGLQPYKDVEDQLQQQVYVEHMQPALRVYLTKLREEAFIDIKPGYADVNASPNESKPVFSAYTPPQKKSKRVKVNKERFRDRTMRASERPPAPPRPRDADDTVTEAAKKPPVGGPTEVATAAYDKTQQQQAATAAAKGAPANSVVSSSAETTGRKPVAKATPVNVAEKQPKTRKYKIRYGQGQKAAQLPEATPETTDQGTAPAGASVSPGDTSVEARLTPESQQMLGNADDAPQKKTRFSQREPGYAKKAKAQAVASKKAAAPAGPDATEVATQAVNTAPLGLNGNTGAKKKAAPVSGDKQRFVAKKNESTPPVQNPGTPGAPAADATQTASVSTPVKKRHKLLGIL